MNSEEKYNEGLMTVIWGSNFWETMHNVSFGYPLNPSKNDKKNYKLFYTIIKYVLPCCECKHHYREHTTKGKLKITDDIFKNKHTLTKWVYDLHNLVNKQNNVLYDITFDDVCNKYESYRLKYNSTPNDKHNAFVNYYNKQPPKITFENAIMFSKYAKLRGLKNFKDNVIKNNKIIKNSKEHIKLNKEVWDKINIITLNYCKNVETEGAYKGYPTIDELYLIERLSTTIKLKSLGKIIDVIKNN
jgi:hypothetical protein